MIILTESAASKIANHLSRNQQSLGIKVGVKTTGCSGLAYVIEYVDSPKLGDIKYISKCIEIFVDPNNLQYLDGLIIDWVRTGLNEGFDFNNPHEKDRCGCGHSFRI